MSTEVVIITPPTASKAIDHDLVALTEYIHRAVNGDEPYFYGLGGPFGYGAEYENDVFVMRQFWWGDCTCGADDQDEETPHAADCRYELPLFEHKASGLRISWYKWIGRSMEINRKPGNKEWRRIFAECVESVHR